MQAHPQRPSLAPALAEPPSGAGLTAGQRRLQKWAWLTLLVNLGVIAWGAYVRASGSGAGCGENSSAESSACRKLVPRSSTATGTSTAALSA